MSDQVVNVEASPEAATVDPNIARATKLQEVTHSGFVGNWEQERKPSDASPSPEVATSADTVVADDAAGG